MRRCNYLRTAALATFALWATHPGLAVADEPIISDVYSFDAGDPDVKGLSALVRTNNGVSMMLTTTDLTPGAYTIWWVINPGTESFSAGFATSHVVGTSGAATFAANLREGEPLSLFGSMEDARLDEIHLLVRYHGPADPSRLKEQLSSFEPELNGVPGLGNVQFSVQVAP